MAINASIFRTPARSVFSDSPAEALILRRSNMLKTKRTSPTPAKIIGTPLEPKISDETDSGDITVPPTRKSTRTKAIATLKSISIANSP